MLYQKCQECVNEMGAAGEDVGEYKIVPMEDCWNHIPVPATHGSGSEAKNQNPENEEENHGNERR